MPTFNPCDYSAKRWNELWFEHNGLNAAFLQMISNVEDLLADIYAIFVGEPALAPLFPAPELVEPEPMELEPMEPEPMDLNEDDGYLADDENEDQV